MVEEEEERFVSLGEEKKKGLEKERLFSQGAVKQKSLLRLPVKEVKSTIRFSI